MLPKLSKFIKHGCQQCKGDLSFLFSKSSSLNGHIYKLFSCLKCKLWQIYPIPSNQILKQLYQGEYFKKRTNRGYDNYLSKKVKKSIYTTFKKNLKDLSFFDYELTLSGNKKALEIGCAAGYFLEYLTNRGWDSEGIEISKTMVQAAKKRGIKVIEGDFLKEGYREQTFDLIVMWATIEHLPDPEKFIKKASKVLKNKGLLIISTCHIGKFAKIYGSQWRYINVPEHIYYFSRRSLREWFHKYGFVWVKDVTYGSGNTTKKSPSFFYKVQKAMMDKIAKISGEGDMIAIAFEKSSRIC